MSFRGTALTQWLCVLGFKLWPFLCRYRSPGAVRWKLRGHPGCFGVSNNGENQTTWVSLTEQNYPKNYPILTILAFVVEQISVPLQLPPTYIEGQHHFLETHKFPSFSIIYCIINRTTDVPPARSTQTPAALSRRQHTLRLRDLVSQRGPWRLQTLRQPRRTGVIEICCIA